MTLKGEITPGKIFAVLCVGWGGYLSLQLQSVGLALVVFGGAYALYGVRKYLIKEMLKNGYTRQNR